MGKPFQTGVYEIGTHGIQGFKSTVQLEIALQIHCFIPQFNTLDSPAPFFHVFNNGGNTADQSWLYQGKKSSKFVLIALVHKMYLTHFFRSQNAGLKAATALPKFGRLTCGSNNRAFFNGHWNGIKLVVYKKIGSNSQGDIKVGKGVFNEFIM